jgi:hypothetical protein
VAVATIRVSTVRCRINSSDSHGICRLGAFGDKDSFHAGNQAVRTQNGTLKMKRLRINSEQNDFRSSITRHLMTTELLERSVKDAEGSAEEEDEEDIE